MADSMPYMLWYAGDFLRSTRGWSVTAKGVYRELLDAQWDLGELPIDPEELRLLIGATPAEWSHGWRKCESKFPIDGSGRRNPRCEEHRHAALTSRQTRLEKSQRAAASRWSKHDGGQSSEHPPSIATRNARGIPGAMLEQCPPAPAPAPAPTPAPTPAPAPKRETRANETADDPDGLQRLIAAYPRRSGRSNWIEAAHYAALRIDEGETWDSLGAAVDRYAAYCDLTLTTGTQFVLTPEKFFSAADRPWLNPWDPPASKADARLASNLDAAAEFMRRTEPTQ